MFRGDIHTEVPRKNLTTSEAIIGGLIDDTIVCFNICFRCQVVHSRAKHVPREYILNEPFFLTLMVTKIEISTYFRIWS